MLSKKGLRERPTYLSLMHELRTDYPLQFPNRDAKFLRNSIQMTQFDGIGLLENLEEEQDQMAQNKIRDAVKKELTSGPGVDSKVEYFDMAKNDSDADTFYSFSDNPMPMLQREDEFKRELMSIKEKQKKQRRKKQEIRYIHQSSRLTLTPIQF